MKHDSAPLLTLGGIAATLALATGVLAVNVLATDVALAKNREAAPGQIRTVDPSKAGGVDCSGATVISGIGELTAPFVDTGNTCGAPTVVSEYQNATCNSVPYLGPELIYRIQLDFDNSITVTLTPSALADMGLFMVSDCTTPTSCVDFHDAIGQGAISQIPRVQTGPFAPGTYYIYVDSYYATGTASCGAYTLDATGSVPVELINFSIE